MDIVSLLETLTTGIFKAEEDFLKDPKKFSEFEERVHALFDKGALQFIEGVLNEADTMICESIYRKSRFDIQRHDKRTLITTVGDAVITQTLFREKETGECRYLLGEMMGLNPHERFSEAAEAQILREAVKTSYAEAAKVLPSQSKISKTTVMNKIHGIAEEIPLSAPGKKKECRFLFIEADEDHIAEQHGNGSSERNGNFISRMAYVYEGYEELCKGRHSLTGIHYEAGLYEGSKGIERFWKKVGRYIRKHYDTGMIERIYVCGDGASWIKAATEYIPESVFVIDKFHLTKYINHAAGQMLDERDLCKSEIYRMLYKGHKKEFTEYTGRMAESAADEDAVLSLRNYVLNNWKAVQTSLHEKDLHGCSAEGHVSHLLSDRMSSRPMGWSRKGADRMSKLRAYVKNYGEEKILELVKYTRAERQLRMTGTDATVPVETKKLIRPLIIHDHYDQARSYIERIQASVPGISARKSFSIREQIRLL